MIVNERVVLKIEDLKYAPYNPRFISESEFDKLVRSIDEFGFTGTLVVNKRNNQVVGGNQSLKALKLLGYKEVESVLVDLSDDEEKALNVALNKISGEWDNSKLDELFGDLELNEFDLSLTGFEIPEIDQIHSFFDEEAYDEDVQERTSLDLKEVGKADVSVAIGVYRAIIPREKFDVWEKELWAEYGTNTDDLVEILLERLGLQ